MISRDANQFMFCGTAIPQSERRLGLGAVAWPRGKNKTQTHQLRNEAQLNCAFRFVPNSIMKWCGELSRVKMNAKKRRP